MAMVQPLTLYTSYTTQWWWPCVLVLMLVSTKGLSGLPGRGLDNFAQCVK